MNLITELRAYLKSPDLYKIEQVQALWSDYGEIARYCVPASCDNHVEQNIIVKHVELPAEISHPRGWNTQTSHQRKISSYKNEEAFYAHYAHISDSYCYVAKHLGSLAYTSPKPLILEDLDALGFDQRFSHADMAQVRLGIRWLAYFHACYIDTPTDDLWPVGTYWHLATRQDEWRSMTDGELKRAANQIDDQLNNAQYQTLVHGDAKLANFCWHQHEQDVAAVDFQYVGKGVGIKDLMYFLGSCLTSDELFNLGCDLVDEYFGVFQHALNHYQKDIEGCVIEREWRMLYPYSWADFHRFLLGWHPKHVKVNRYMQKQTEAALAGINQ